MINNKNNKIIMKKNQNNTNNNYGKNENDILIVFSSFIVDLNEQRKLLTPNQRDNFDLRWGIDPTGEFYKYWTNFGLVNNETIIKNEIKKWAAFAADVTSNFTCYGNNLSN